jgi:hypothetical protein
MNRTVYHITLKKSILTSKSQQKTYIKDTDQEINLDKYAFSNALSQSGMVCFVYFNIFFFFSNSNKIEINNYII